MAAPLTLILGLSNSMTAALGIALYFGAAALMGWWNLRRGNKFSYGFLVSIVFTFIGGFLFVALTDKGKPRQKAKSSKKRKH